MGGYKKIERHVPQPVSHPPYIVLYTSTMDIETQLEHIDELENFPQLVLLKQESSHLTIHGIMPSVEWFHARFRHILLYQSIDWQDLARQFEHKHNQIYTLSVTIYQILQYIINEYETKETYNLHAYNQVLHHIHDVWTIYSTTYIGDETDMDIVDLIAGMMHM